MYKRETLGLTKSQVKNIIKLGKQHHLYERPLLQTLQYRADSKMLFFTDGFLLYVWDLTRADDIPAEDVVVSRSAMLAWASEAKAKDIWYFQTLLREGKPDNTVDAPGLLNRFKAEPDAPVSDCMALDLLDRAITLAEDRDAKITIKQNGRATSIMAEIDDELVPQTILVMGKTK